MRRCKQCKKEIAAHSKSTTFYEKKGFCCEDHCVAWAVEASKKKEKREIKKAKKVLYANDRGHQKGLTQIVFNTFIRALDKGKPCHSCGKEKCGTWWDAGHVVSVGSNDSLRFDPRNCFLQGSGCNRANHKRTGRQETVSSEYKRRIGEMYGQEHLSWLEGPHEIKNYIIEDLKELRAMFAEETRRLERGEKPSKNWREL